MLSRVLRAGALLHRAPLTVQSAAMYSTATKVSVANLKQLRQETEISLKLCRQALEQSGDDIAKARQWLEETQSARAAKAKSKLGSRSAAEGRVGIATQDSTAAVVQLNCETDFVARNDKFSALSDNVGAALLAYAKASGSQSTDFVNVPAETLAALPLNDSTVRQAVDDMIALLGENIVISDSAYIAAPESNVLGTYAHVGKYAACVCLDTSDKGKASEVSNRVAQHIVAMDPPSTEELLSQPFVLDSSKTVADVLGSDTTIVSFQRWQL
eukprot:m.252926 g.252926  ORF g.252926 m.252926 type:complete len:271 (-) comp15478_c1_seq1:4213-5025(-)